MRIDLSRLATTVSEYDLYESELCASLHQMVLYSTGCAVSGSMTTLSF